MRTNKDIYHERRLFLIDPDGRIIARKEGFDEGGDGEIEITRAEIVEKSPADGGVFSLLVFLLLFIPQRYLADIGIPFASSYCLYTNDDKSNRHRSIVNIHIEGRRAIIGPDNL